MAGDTKVVEYDSERFVGTSVVECDKLRLFEFPELCDYVDPNDKETTFRSVKTDREDPWFWN